MSVIIDNEPETANTAEAKAKYFEGIIRYYAHHTLVRFYDAGKRDQFLAWLRQHNYNIVEVPDRMAIGFSAPEILVSTPRPDNVLRFKDAK